MPILAAAAPPFLAELAALVVAGAVIGYICKRIGLVPIVGFLVTGVIIGPHALALVTDMQLVNSAAEIGVILLLFTIGIEFSLEKLAKIKGLIFGGGGMQVGLTTLATTLILLAAGVDWRVGVFTGFLVALSSTAIVLKLLGDRSETGTPAGQVSLGLLIFQDLAIIVMVLFVPMLQMPDAHATAAASLDAVAAAVPPTGGGVGEIALTLGKAIGIILIVLLVARRVMPIVLEFVAKTCSGEIFLLTVIGICLGTAWLTSLADISVSLGAFLAGLVVSESRFSEHAFGEILPLRILFSAVFFVSVGMMLNLSALMEHLPLVLAALVLVLLLKLGITALAVRTLGYRWPMAISAGLLLAQVGEFSFVLVTSGAAVGLTPAGMGETGRQVFIAATVLSMILTPLLAVMAARCAARDDDVPLSATPESGGTHDHSSLTNHVIVAGYGQAARRLVRVMRNSRIPFVITTLSPAGADEAEADGLPVVRGDASKLHTLESVNFMAAKAVVIADDEPEMTHRVTSVVHNLNPALTVIARTRFAGDAPHLDEAGANHVVTEELESVVQVFTHVLRDYRIAEDDIVTHVSRMRAGSYAVLEHQADEAHAPVVCSLDEACFDSRHLRIREGAPAAGRTLAAIGLGGEGNESGIEVHSVRRADGSRIPHPPADLALSAGDELELIGKPSSLAGVLDHFRVAAPGTAPTA